MSAAALAQEPAVLFNAAVVAASVAAAEQLGLLDALEGATGLSLRAFARAQDLHLPTVEAIGRALIAGGIAVGDGERLSPGPAFSRLRQNAAYFSWLLTGYAHLMGNLAEAARNDRRGGDVIRRNGGAIARAGRDYGARFVDQHFEALLATSRSRVVADLGCGSGERLIRYARRVPDALCYGIDVSTGAVALAEEAVAAAGLQGRVRIVHGDMRRLPRLPGFDEVELLFSFFNGHDLWPRANCLHVLDALRETFPRAGRFLLCDTWRAEHPAAEPPIFTLGFDLTHAAMGQEIPTLADWLALLQESRWACAAVHEIGIAFSGILDLRPAARAKARGAA